MTKIPTFVVVSVVVVAGVVGLIRILRQQKHGRSGGHDLESEPDARNEQRRESELGARRRLQKHSAPIDIPGGGRRHPYHGGGISGETPFPDTEENLSDKELTNLRPGNQYQARRNLRRHFKSPLAFPRSESV